MDEALRSLCDTPIILVSHEEGRVPIAKPTNYSIQLLIDSKARRSDQWRAEVYGNDVNSTGKRFLINVNFRLVTLNAPQVLRGLRRASLEERKECIFYKT